jgi:cysteinyl-tRNA synthetase
MTREIKLFNTLTKQKEVFTPIIPGYVGMYVCGPTVYSDVHLGNCRSFISFDIIYRYLQYVGYKVRYVRNITDVGHLEGDADTGAEDKISKKARLEQLEPMEIAQKYSNGFHDMMKIFNVLPPSIEPRATGHIPEQINMVRKILENGYAYEAEGSVYFDTLKFAQDTGLYGQLSGRVLDDLVAESRDNLKKQDQKRHPSDFAIWIKADDTHLMRWDSPWSVGFPGWHLECSAMSTKYLGDKFDIHGGGGDLTFPHHENEIAQNYGACKNTPANYWLHGNMLLMNGRKMAKSDGNTITPTQLFTGDSPHVSKGYAPMVVRFFMLQSHFRSTLDLSDSALQAAEKGYTRMMEAWKVLQNMEGATGQADSEFDQEIKDIFESAFQDMDDDFNTPKALAKLFDMVTKINSLAAGIIPLTSVTPETLSRMKTYMHDFLFNIFGLKDESAIAGDDNMAALDGVMSLLLDIRQQARQNKDWATSDQIRDRLAAVGLQVKDSKEGATWSKING